MNTKYQINLLKQLKNGCYLVKYTGKGLKTLVRFVSKSIVECLWKLTLEKMWMDGYYWLEKSLEPPKQKTNQMTCKEYDDLMSYNVEANDY